MKAPGSTWEWQGRLSDWSVTEDRGIPGVAVKCVEIGKNTDGKAAVWVNTDAEVRQRGEQTGLDTLVVHAVNDEN